MHVEYHQACSLTEVKEVLLGTSTKILSCHHQETSCITSAITALLNLHRGSNASPAELLTPEALTGYCEVQNFKQKGYILMKLEEHNAL